MIIKFFSFVQISSGNFQFNQSDIFEHINLNW